MTIAGFVLGIVATVLAAASLTWQVVARRSLRPTLTPIVGLLTPDGLVLHDAGRDVSESLAAAAGKLPSGPFFIGVNVVNTGRSPLRVARWAIRADPGGTSLLPVDPAIGGTKVPHEIPPGASAIFFTELHRAHRFAEAAQRVANQPPRIVLTVSTGDRSYATNPVAPALFLLGSQT
ncbi:hypothetical protein MB901379_03948 [Mycobacterium basiliense]|uniref:Uncharacterized protein n=1 Tax=Mycobacterium basiliense TaxID=2094119 RepID=A0A3S5D013_9MYCO|nr:hypothetical protein [Mycobacterium basiliense]VDM90350.1 hypothetical protein MB901379_03948 [Mycobacterium basiliense]